MGESELNLDNEFRRYLQIMRPYLGLLEDRDTIEICNAWIQRLSKCKKREKYLRNKYVFALCFQLAQGIFEDPFNKYPTDGKLSPLNDGLNSDVSSEVEYVVINADEESTKVIYDKKPSTDAECVSQSVDFEDYDKSNGSSARDKELNPPFQSDPSNKNSDMPTHRQTLIYYACPETGRNTSKSSSGTVIEGEYKNRTHNLIMKLREIKLQNERLHNELEELKEESKTRSECCGSDKIVSQVDKSTSAYCQISASPSLISTLKFKLQEVQDSRNVLIETIKHLQEKIENLNEGKKHELEDLKEAHKHEILRVESTMKEEISKMYEKKLGEQKVCYENKLEELQNNIDFNKNEFDIQKNMIVTEKDKMIKEKDLEIMQLNRIIEEQKNNLHSIINKLSEKPKESTDEKADGWKLKAEHLEKRLSRLEKSKSKCIRLYEAKLANLQRERHLAECSLQLQLGKQRAQVINEVTNENQAELATTINKLETKYKEIVANVQSTAIQRRVQDQMTLDSIVQASMKTENMLPNCRGTNRSQFSGRTMQNQSRDDNGLDSEISSLLRGNKVGNVMVGNKSFGEDSVMASYCLDGERMGQLFERVYIPQRDTSDRRMKK